MSNNSSTASRVAAHNSKGVPYTGWIEGVGYQHLRNRPMVNCYFRDGGVSLPNFEPVIDTSPKMRVASVGGKYRVEQGENLSIIARRFGTTPDAIMAANPSIDWAVARKKGALIYPGELLEIPPVFEEANAQNRPVPRAETVDLKSFYGEKGRGGGSKARGYDDQVEANLWFGLGLGFDISILGLGGKIQVNGPNVNLYNNINGKSTKMNGVRWFNAKAGYALANGEYGRYYNGVDTKGNSNLQLGVTEFNNQDGIRYAPLKLGFHFFIIGGDVSISRSIWDVGREYNEARQEFFEKTGTAMPRR